MGTLQRILEETAAKARDALLAHSRHVTVPAGTRMLTERRRAFRISEGGSVDLPTRVPGRQDVVVGSLGHGGLLWSWMFRPSTWHLGPTATREAAPLECDAAVRELCNEDSAVGRSVSPAVAAVVADRLGSARTRLLDFFAPHGSGTPLARAR